MRAPEHIGRSWTGHHIEDACPCPKAPCGLVDAMTIDPDCNQHSMTAAKSIRQMHRADDCPAQPEESTEEPVEFKPELGQMLFSETVQNQYETPDFVTNGLKVLAALIQEQRGDENPLTTNWSDGDDYLNEVFELRAYCWCDGEKHLNGCPPNFAHRPSGTSVSWYKHSGRGTSINRNLTVEGWSVILISCLQSLLDDN